MRKTGVIAGMLFGLLFAFNLSAGMLGDIGKDAARRVEDKATNKVLNEPQAAAAAAIGGGKGGVQVEWKGSWYPAHILKTKGDQYYIHYDGYSDSWNEWVGPGRIKK